LEGQSAQDFSRRFQRWAVAANHVRSRMEQAFNVAHYSTFTASFTARCRPLSTTCAARSEKSRRDFTALV